MVQTDPARDCLDIGARHLAHVCDLVDETDARGEERVRGHLDHFRRRDVRPQNGGVDKRVEGGDGVRVLLGERPDDDAVWTSEVVETVPSARNSGFET